MSLITKLFAPDLDFQTKRADLLDGQLKHAETKIERLEKTIIDERKAKDKFCITLANTLSKQAGLPMKFVDTTESKVEEEKPKPNYFNEERIRVAAEQQRDWDLRPVNGDENRVRPLAEYADAIRANPEYVFIDQ